MNYRKVSFHQLASESIAQQSGAFFRDLCDDLSYLRDDAAELWQMEGRKFFKSTPIKRILATVRRHTQINLTMTEGGPAIIPPILDTNHVFYREQRESIEDWKRWYYSELPFIEKAMKALDTKVVVGSVDLVNSKVGGVYALMEMPLYMPQDMLVGDDFTVEEIASIILHEVGHAFTYFEYVSRSIGTNQVLSTMIRTLDKTVSYEERRVVLQRGCEKLKLDKEINRQLEQCETPEQLTIVTVAAAAEQVVSELGYNLYDANSCEQMADQFATRHGAGVHLVTALDKLLRITGVVRVIIFMSNMVILASALFLIVSTMGLAAPVLILMLIFGPDKNDDIYDNSFTRFDRVKRQLIEELKVCKGDERKKAILDEIKVIENVCEHYKDELSWIESVAYLLRPGYRAAHNVEKLQKDLERIASNDLFAAAARMKMLSGNA